VRGRVAAQSLFRTSLLIALVAASAVSAPETARAQGLFDVLRNIFGGGQQQRKAPPPLLEHSPGGDVRDDVRIPGDGGGPHASYCVRLCDGRYFPLSAKGGSQSPQQMCSAMCPTAKTDVYSGSGIERAMSSSGKPYSALPNAFVYRDRLVNDCTCTGKDPTGVAQIDAQSDPTLRPGDIVVTKDGPVVFQGDRRSRKSSDFVPAEEDKRLPQQVRQELSKIRIAQPSGPANVRSEVTGALPVSASAKGSVAAAPVPARGSAAAASGTVPAKASAASVPPMPGSALGFMPENLTTMRGFGPGN
jgi:hypothetical protein